MPDTNEPHARRLQTFGNGIDEPRSVPGGLPEPEESEAAAQIAFFREKVVPLAASLLAPALDSRIATFQKWSERERERQFFDAVYARTYNSFLVLTSGQDTKEKILGALESARMNAQTIAEAAVQKRRDAIGRDFTAAPAPSTAAAPITNPPAAAPAK